MINGVDPYLLVTKALEVIDGQALFSPEDTVLIKPKYVSAKPPSISITSDAQVIESIIAYVKNIGVKDIIVGEGGAGDAEKAFDMVGILEVVQRQRVRLVSVNRDRCITVSVSAPLWGLTLTQ